MSMTSSVPGHGLTCDGFEAPLAKLSACHDRVGRQCAALRRLATQGVHDAADEDASTVAAAVMRFFDTSAKDHHADEEADLFPALIESMAGSDAVCLREMIEASRAEHRELTRRWSALRPVLAALAGGQRAPLPSDAVDGFIDLYARHIAREEAELLPMAGRLLGDADLERIAHAMRRRRGLDDEASSPT